MPEVDLSAAIFAEYKRAMKRAEENDRKGAFPEAAAAYRQAGMFMKEYAEYAADRAMRKQRLQRAADLTQTADRLSKKAPPKPAQGIPTRGKAEVQPAAETEDDYEAQVTALIQKTHVRWEDIGGLEDTKAAIKTAYGMALARPPAGVKISALRNVLLFGPPGTGKTLLAAATAGNLEAAFFNVKVSSLLSKYFGESTKLISALYTVSRRMSPAVVFLDEFEALTPPRGLGESGAERRIVSTLLAELDGLATKDDPGFVLTMGATNLPWLLDSAMLSRFQRRIFIPLPDEPARRAILDIHLLRRGHKSLVSAEDLVRRTQGFSGREIEQLCQTAITHMTQRANPDLLSKVDSGQAAIRGYTIRVEALNEGDFKTAFEQIRPIASPEMMRRYQDWVKQADS